MSTSYISTILLASVVLLLYLSYEEQKQMISGSQILLEERKKMIHLGHELNNQTSSIGVK